MNIHQLSVNYVQEHDRILVRINTTAGQELRLWLTRRLALSFMPLAQQTVTQWVARQEAATSPQITPTATADAQTQRMLAEFKREASLQNADFQTPYKSPSALPLGAEPLLVTEISVTPLPSGQLQLSFNETLPAQAGQSAPSPRGFRVALEQKLVHGLVHLLENAIALSRWEEAVTPQTTAQTPASDEAPTASEARPKYLN